MGKLLRNIENCMSVEFFRMNSLSHMIEYYSNEYYSDENYSSRNEIAYNKGK